MKRSIIQVIEQLPDCGAARLHPGYMELLSYLRDSTLEFFRPRAQIQLVRPRSARLAV